MKYFHIVLLFLFFHQVGMSQFNDNFLIREKFYFEVGQIEEFIERFNFEDKTKLLNYLDINQPDMEISRLDFLYTLFEM